MERILTGYAVRLPCAEDIMPGEGGGLFRKLSLLRLMVKETVVEGHERWTA